MPERSNAERLHDVYDRFWNSGDWRAGTDLFAPDIVWITHVPGVWKPESRGLEEVNAFFRDWLESWEEYSTQFEVIEISPDVVVVESTFHGRGKGSGLEFESDLGQVWEFADGLVVRQTMYRTKEEARRAADLLEPSG